LAHFPKRKRTLRVGENHKMNKEDSLSFIRSELQKTLQYDQKRLSKEEILEIVISSGRSQASAYRDWTEIENEPTTDWEDIRSVRKLSKNGSDNELIFDAFRTAIPIYQDQNKHLEACQLAAQFATTKKQLRSF